MSETEKKFRSSDRFEILNARVMWVGEPREISADKTLCSVKVVSQPGNDKDKDCWVTVTGANKLGEFLYSLKPGDVVHAAGKPFFGAYIDKNDNPVPTLELKYPEFVLKGRAGVDSESAPAADDTEEEETPPAKEVEKPVKRGPGRPKKSLPFDQE